MWSYSWKEHRFLHFWFCGVAPLYVWRIVAKAKILWLWDLHTKPLNRQKNRGNCFIGRIHSKLQRLAEKKPTKLWVRSELLCAPPISVLRITKQKAFPSWSLWFNPEQKKETCQLHFPVVERAWEKDYGNPTWDGTTWAEYFIHAIQFGSVKLQSQPQLFVVQDLWCIHIKYASFRRIETFSMNQYTQPHRIIASHYYTLLQILPRLSDRREWIAGCLIVWLSNWQFRLAEFWQLWSELGEEGAYRQLRAKWDLL